MYDTALVRNANPQRTTYKGSAAVVSSSPANAWAGPGRAAAVKVPSFATVHPYRPQISFTEGLQRVAGAVALVVIGSGAVALAMAFATR